MYLLHPHVYYTVNPYLRGKRSGQFLKETGLRQTLRTRCAAIVNHNAIVSSLRDRKFTTRSIFSTAWSLGERHALLSLVFVEVARKMIKVPSIFCPAGTPKVSPKQGERIINEGVACVCAKWCGAFLCIFAWFCIVLCVSVFFATKMGGKKAQICAEFCKHVQKALLCNTPFSYNPFKRICVSPTKDWKNSRFSFGIKIFNPLLRFKAFLLSQWGCLGAVFSQPHYFLN